ncbi:MAG: Ppx/GppA phosphatase family protein [Thermoleophilia bacterium]
MKVGVIDTGTNSTRLLVAEAGEEHVHELERLTTVTRLGDGVDAGGRLRPQARRRVHACVGRYASIIQELGVLRVLLIATSSVREASDGEEFLTSLADSYGFESRVLSGEEEARLSFAGAALGIGPDERVTLFDIGGGSTEMVSGRDGNVEFALSLKLGCVRLTERFLKSDPVESAELQAASAYIGDMLEREINLGLLIKPDRTIAVAGTATALAAMDLGLQGYDRKLVHGHVIRYERIAELLSQLAAMTVAQKLDIPTMETGRADVVVAGALILEHLMRYTGAGDVFISELDILDGTALFMGRRLI